MKTIKTLLGAGLVLASTTLSGTAANLLNNGNFNTGDLTGWWTWTGADASHTVAVDSIYTFDASPKATMGSATATWRAAMGQSATIGANLSYNLSLDFSATDTPSWGSAAVSINYYDAANTYLGFEWIPLYNQQAAPNTPGQWLGYNNDFSTPANTAYLNLEFDVWNWTTFNVDNVVLQANAVPEPTAAALLGLAGSAGLVTRRR